MREDTWLRGLWLAGVLLLALGLERLLNAYLRGGQATGFTAHPLLWMATIIGTLLVIVLTAHRFLGRKRDGSGVE